MESFIMYLPAGTHRITAKVSNEPRIRETTVNVDRDTCQVLQKAFEAYKASGQQRPFLDFDHANNAASAWVNGFEWRDIPQPGVYVKLELSDAGQRAIEGHSYRSFSPSIFVDDAGKVTGAPINMGGLVNDPAFRDILPLWCSKCADSQKAFLIKAKSFALSEKISLAEAYAYLAKNEPQFYELYRQSLFSSNPVFQDVIPLRCKTACESPRETFVVMAKNLASSERIPLVQAFQLLAKHDPGLYRAYCNTF